MEWKINNKSKYKTKLDEAKLEKRANIHSFHRYYGKLIPAIPHTFIKEFTNENDLVGSDAWTLECLFDQKWLPAVLRLLRD